ncbi:tetratricopeptide repeat protein [Thermocoleostomius sinensis]|uniref:Tetratricopeptide repeat protein n=1 Tax=Thermocoleostomius sinensis A174 TaxID=2016057 RepID=A0A9E9CB89_9CYAN|nr:tetratricopeptide repeat protein [Thermocoleostomius sinensis]WAL60080.1 tetratricopeptide repeat protein [Thermocoleostomius sinensis A174]
MRYVLAWLGLATTVFTTPLLWTRTTLAAPPLQREENSNQLNLTTPETPALETSAEWTQYCITLVQAGHYADAITACQTALDLDKDWEDSDASIAWYYNGSALRAQGQLQPALHSYEKAIRERSTFSLAEAERCRVLLEMQQRTIHTTDTDENTPHEEQRNEELLNELQTNCHHQTILDNYAQALTEHPDDPIAWLHQGTFLAQLNRSVRALRSYDQAIQLIPTYSLALAHRCAVLNQLKRYQAAIADCERAVRGNGVWEDETPAYAWSQRSYALLEMEQYHEAVASAQQAIQLAPTYADAWNNQAVGLWRLARYDEAAVAIAEAVTLNPQSVQARFNQGRIFSSMQQYDNAIQAYCQAINSQAISRSALYCTALPTDTELVQSTEQNLEQAIDQSSDQLIDQLTDQPSENSINSSTPVLNTHTNQMPIDPSIEADVLVNLGAALWYAGRYQSALETTQAALSLNPESFAGWYNQGVILSVLGRSSEALAAYDQANRLSPQLICVLADALRIQATTVTLPVPACEPTEPASAPAKITGE